MNLSILLKKNLELSFGKNIRNSKCAYIYVCMYKKQKTKKIINSIKCYFGRNWLKLKTKVLFEISFWPFDWNEKSRPFHWNNTKLITMFTYPWYMMYLCLLHKIVNLVVDQIQNWRKIWICVVYLKGHLFEMVGFQ